MGLSAVLASVVILLAGVAVLVIAARAGQLDQRPQEPQDYLGGRRKRRRDASQR